MPLISLELQNFRRFENLRLEFHPHRNLVVGGNATGKSTILEAIQYLSTGKSVRSRAPEALIRSGSQAFIIKAICESRGYQHNLSVACREGEKQVVIDGAGGAKSHETARILPVSLLSPESHYDFQKEIKHRRSAIDWVLFHVEQGYQVVWSRYQRVLLQRNAELKRSSSPRVISAWNEELALHGDMIHHQRAELLQKLNPIFTEICNLLNPALTGFELQFKSGWSAEKGLLSCLLRDFDLDRRQGFTHSGPHRSDLVISGCNRRDSSELSHGQRKLLFVALKLAQVTFLHRACSLECTLLVDDLSAELDTDSQESATRLLSEYPGQIVMTSLENHAWSDTWADFRSFHVKHGNPVATPK